MHKPLTELINDTIAAGQVHLPVFPGVARQVTALLAAGSPPPAALEQLISHDPVLASNLFRAANSSFYKGLHKVVTIDEAITRIGVGQAVEVVVNACREGELCPRGRFSPRYITPLWQHALGCAVGARWLAGRCGYEALADQVHLAGLLHDIGKLYLLATLEQIACGPEFDGVLADQLVVEVIEKMHVELGLQLIEDWNLPDSFAAASGRHHDGGLDAHDLVVVLVKLANKGCRKVGLGCDPDPGMVLPTTAEAQFLGIDEISLAEYEIMLEDHFHLATAETGVDRA